MKQELDIKQQIIKANDDVCEAMIENFEAGIAIVQAEDRKKKAHYMLQQANSRLQGLQNDMYSVSLGSINQKVDDKVLEALGI